MRESSPDMEQLSRWQAPGSEAKAPESADAALPPEAQADLDALQIAFDSFIQKPPDVETVRTARERVKGFISSLRETKMFRPIMSVLAVLSGLSAMALRPERLSALEREEAVQIFEVAEREIKSENKKEKPAVVISEWEARHGLEGWNTRALSEFQALNVEQRDIWLHPETSRLSPREYVNAFAAMAERAKNEFRHSSLFRVQADRAISLAVELLPTLPEPEAEAVFAKLATALQEQVGLAKVLELRSKTLEALPEGHALGAFVSAIELGDANALKKSRKNMLEFNQIEGLIRVYNQAPDGRTLLDTFPGNGGDPDATAFSEDNPDSQEMSRTPDGVFAYARAERHVSWSWQYAAIPGDAKLRVKDNKKFSDPTAVVEYQDLDGKWYDATGPDTTFFHGTIKPNAKKPSAITRAYLQEVRDEAVGTSWVPFELADFASPNNNSQLATTWEKNEFGKLSILMNNKAGKRMKSLFHPAPHEINFLDHSHGCTHVFADQIAVLDAYLDKNSPIVITSRHTMPALEVVADAR